jgi:hypothetical protein
MLKNTLKDFLTNLKRTKIEHAISVKFSKSEFAISIKNAQESAKISLERMDKAHELSVKRANASFAKAVNDQKEDLLGYYETYATTQEDMVKETNRIIDGIAKGSSEKIKTQTELATKWMSAQLKLAKKIYAEWKRLIDGISSDYQDPVNVGSGKGGQGINTIPTPRNGGNGASESSGSAAPSSARASTSRAGKQSYVSNVGACLHEVSRWLKPGGIPGAGDPAQAWAMTKGKHTSKNPPAGVPVYWSGGQSKSGSWHVALSMGGGWVRSTDWPDSHKVSNVKIDDLTKAWKKHYLGWGSDAWGHKLAEGALVKAKPGGVRATLAEAGSNEAVIPLNSRGVDFLSSFTVNVAREVARSLPRTPVSSPTHTTTDNSRNFKIDKVEVKTNDPKEFARRLQIEASKKKAALYKG